MRRTAMLWETFVMRFEGAYGRYRRGRLSADEAGEALGMSGRQFRRLCGRYEEEGVQGLADRRLGKPSPRRVPEAQRELVCRLYRETYRGFNAKHFHEQLQERHDYALSYTFTRLTLQGAGLIEKHAQRGGHRLRRERRPLLGMMLLQDGSTHEWIVGLGPTLDLIVTLDDATSQVYSAFLVAQEGTFSSFQGLHEVIAAHGLFGSLYTDRATHYWLPDEAGGVDRSRLTQVGRALKQLGITHIPSFSPQGRGRIERAFGTFQDRLPKELALHAITTPEAANRYLREVFVPAYNRRFAVAAAEPGTAFIDYRGHDLAEILCVQEERVVTNDNCVRYKRLILQIPPQRHRHHYVRARLRVHEHADGTLAIFDGPRCLARYAANGRLRDPAAKVA